MKRRAFAAGLGLVVLMAGSASAASLSIAQGGAGQQGSQQLQQPLVLVSQQPLDFAGGQGGVALQGLPDLRQIKLSLNPDRTVSLITANGRTIVAKPQIDKANKAFSAVFDLGQGANLQATVTLGDAPPAKAVFVLNNGQRRLTAQSTLAPDQAGGQGQGPSAAAGNGAQNGSTGAHPGAAGLGNGGSSAPSSGRAY